MVERLERESDYEAFLENRVREIQREILARLNQTGQNFAIVVARGHRHRGLALEPDGTWITSAAFWGPVVEDSSLNGLLKEFLITTNGDGQHRTKVLESFLAHLETTLKRI